MDRGDDFKLGRGWWHGRWAFINQAVNYYLYGGGQSELKAVMFEKYIKQVHTTSPSA